MAFQESTLFYDGNELQRVKPVEKKEIVPSGEKPSTIM